MPTPSPYRIPAKAAVTAKAKRVPLPRSMLGKLFALLFLAAWIVGLWYLSVGLYAIGAWPLGAAARVLMWVLIGAAVLNFLRR